MTRTEKLLAAGKAVAARRRARPIVVEVVGTPDLHAAAEVLLPLLRSYLEKRAKSDFPGEPAEPER